MDEGHRPLQSDWQHGSKLFEKREKHDSKLFEKPENLTAS
jgi:hypothetical protein